MEFERPDMQEWELNEQDNAGPPFGEQQWRLLRIQETQIGICISSIEKMQEQLEEMRINHQEELRALQYRQEKIAKEMNCIDNRLQDNEVHFEREKAELQKIVVQHTTALVDLEQALKVRRLDDSCRNQVGHLAEENRGALSALEKHLVELVSSGEQSTLTMVDAKLEAMEIAFRNTQYQRDNTLNDRIERVAAQTEARALLCTAAPAMDMENAEVIAALIADKLHSTGRNTSLSEEMRESDSEALGMFAEHRTANVTDTTAEKSYPQLINRIAQLALAAQAAVASTERKLATLAAAELEGFTWKILLKIPSDVYTFTSQAITRLISPKHLGSLISFVPRYSQLKNTLWGPFVAHSRFVKHGVLAVYRGRLMYLSRRRTIYLSVFFLTFLGSLSYLYWLIRQSSVHQDLNGRRVPRRVRKPFYTIY